MDKRKLSALPRQEATGDMLDIADRIGGLRHIITAELTEDGTILVIYVYPVKDLKKGKREAIFRTFLSKDDYITQKLDTDKVRWLTSSFYNMRDFSLFESCWNHKTHSWDHVELVYIRSKKEKNVIREFFREFAKKEDIHVPWTSIYRFQEAVKADRLAKKHRKETDPIDALMETVSPVPEEFTDWIREEGMSFSQYLIYSPFGKKLAQCTCTCCKEKMVVAREEVRLRNNEKGVCPKCGKHVTYKAKGKFPTHLRDERYIGYIDPRDGGFIWRYFHVSRIYQRDELPKSREYIDEVCRTFYRFGENGEAERDSYEYTEFRQSGKIRWCHDMGKIPCLSSLLYPGNLPEAWFDTPMKYSAIEILSKNDPTVVAEYERAVTALQEFPAIEWFCKMGLNNLARYVLDSRYFNNSDAINYKGKTIYEILGLNKVNTRIFQAIDGDERALRLLQAAQRDGIQFKPEQLKEYYEAFGCNTELLKKAKRKVSLHKIVRYIEKESENYPIGENGCWQYSYMRFTERKDPRIERKQNLAKDWVEYIGWCTELKYDLDNLFIYLPKNFKKVHDRTAGEYQALQDKKKAAEKKRRERQAQKEMEKTRAFLSDILSENHGTTDAFSIKGKGLVLVVPKDAQDIKNEGETLHHCVGTYIEKVARGETSIFFIRKEKEPEKPYYTMEWKNDQVYQCRGLRNVAMTPEVKAFTQAFEQIMHDAENRRAEQRKAVRVGV
ncbi:MAG: PcfJ domain-containing protein [Lachnospiraceae bacterium]|nr:PcfJ domain-containing protein [Lachnospiraceae bacterium]